MRRVSAFSGILQVFTSGVNTAIMRMAVFTALAVAVVPASAQDVSSTQKMYVWKDSSGVTHIDSKPGPSNSRELEFVPAIQPQPAVASNHENSEKTVSADPKPNEAKQKQAANQSSTPPGGKMPQNDDYSRRLADAYHKAITARNLGDKSRFKHWLHQYNKLKRENGAHSDAEESQ